MSAPIAFAAGIYTITNSSGNAITAPTAVGQPLTVESATAGALNQQWLVNGAGVFIDQNNGFTVTAAGSGSTVNSQSAANASTPFVVMKIADLQTADQKVSGSIVSVDKNRLCWAVNGTSQVYVATKGSAVTWTFTPVAL